MLRLKQVLSGLLVVSFLLIQSNQVIASPEYQQQTSVGDSCYSLNVIFIIDQSGSMSGDGGEIPTDPTDQRATAVEAMIDWLADNALTRCTQARHQVGVISFGSDAQIDYPQSDNAQVDIPMKVISPDDFQEYLALTKSVQEAISPTNLGLTDPLKAFKLAKKMLDQNSISGSGPTKKVIIFLTDGQINQGDGRPAITTTQEFADWINLNLPFNSTLLKREKCLLEKIDAYGSLEDAPYEKLNECIQNYDVPEAAYNDSVYIEMVLLNYGLPWSTSVKQLLTKVTETHAGKVMDFYDTGEIENRNKIPTYFQTVLSKLIGIPSGETSCGPNIINPYLDRATFTFYKYSPDTVVKMRYTDISGVEHVISNGKSNDNGFTIEEYAKYGTNERYIFKDPYPGIWYIESDRCSNGGVNIFYSELAIDAAKFSLNLPSIPQYDIEPFFDKSDPFYITYQMKDTTGNVVLTSPDPYFAVNAKAVIIDPDGNMIEYPMSWDESADQFRTDDPIQVPVSGKYSVNLSGTIKIHNGSLPEGTLSKEQIFNTEKVLFKDDNLEFQVHNVTPFVINNVKPKTNQRLPQIHTTILQGWPLKVKPIDVKIHIAQRTEELTIPISQVIPDPGNAFHTWIEFPDGSTTERILMTQDPNDPYGFMAQIQGIETTNPMDLHISLTGDFSSDYRPDQRNLEIPITRYDSLPFYREGFYYFLLILLITLIIAKIIYEIWLRQHKLSGSIDFRMNSNTIDSIPLYNGKRLSCFKKSRVQSVHLKRLCIRNIPQSKNQDDSFGQSLIVIEVKGVSECNEKFKFKLSPNESNGYCNNHPEYEIFYKIEA